MSGWIIRKEKERSALMALYFLYSILSIDFIHCESALDAHSSWASDLSREKDDFDGSFGLWLSVKEVCSILLEVRNLWVWLLKYWVFLIDLGID